LEGTSKICCSPKNPHNASPRDRVVFNAKAELPKTNDGMVRLPGGRFLMGTDYAYGFPLDGEGPIRPVTLSPFCIDIAPVTNAQFSEFMSASGYTTEAERFGWSFVFWAEIPASLIQPHQ
jgi:formylglycine-generating enzyme required for sulfatase activity